MTARDVTLETGSSNAEAELRTADATRRTVHRALLGAALPATVLSLAHAVLRGGPFGGFVLPVLVECLVLILGMALSRAMANGLRVDSLTLFLGWEALRGCVAPTIIQWFGSGSNFFWRPGSVGDATTVLWLGVLFAAFVVTTRGLCGVAGTRSRSSSDRSASSSSRSLVPQPLVTGPVPASVLVVLGLVGTVMRFPSIDAVLDFVTGDFFERPLENGPLVFVSASLRPLLVVGVAMVLRDRYRAGSGWRRMIPPLAIAAVFALGSFGLNRAAILFACLAPALAATDRSRRALRIGPLALVLVAIGLFFFFVGTFRSTLALERTGLDAPEIGVVPALQSVLVYAASPMQLAGALPWAAATDAFGGASFINSLLSPLPSYPDAWREQSGVALYNHAVYHSYIGKDQLVPVWFESFLSFGWPGIVLVGVVAGMLISFADIGRLRARSFPAAFAAAIVAFWVTQAGCVGSYSIVQNFLYFAAPALVVLAVSRVFRRGVPHPAAS